MEKFKSKPDIWFLSLSIIITLTFAVHLYFRESPFTAIDAFILLQPFVILGSSYFHAKHPHQSKVIESNPLSKLKIEEQNVFVGQLPINISRISKVVLDRAEGSGLLQFPFNRVEGKIPEIWFEVSEYYKVEHFVKTNLPQAQIIT